MRSAHEFASSKWSRAIGALLAISLVLLLLPRVVTAQTQANTITFENRSASPALVKLVGLSEQVVEVPSNGTRTISVNAGTYHILVRYGTPGQYSYSKGDSFNVPYSASGWSVITITLQKAVGGNYRTREASKAEFDRI